MLIADPPPTSSTKFEEKKGGQKEKNVTHDK